MSKVILITGASSGIGAAIAARLEGDGHTVYGTSRNSDAALPAAGVRMIAMDVRQDDDVARGVAKIVKDAGRIDVLVNNAGFGLAGAIEDTSVDDMRRQLDTNFFGALRLIQAVLPHMRVQRAGRIVNIGSLAGRIAIPFQGAYCASKFALEGMSEALSMELKPFGIDVVLIEPGDTRSNFNAGRAWTAASQKNSAYAAHAKHAVAVMVKSEHAGPPPDKVAKIVSRAIAANRPRLRYVSGSALEHTALVLQRFLPDRLFESIVAGNYALPKKS